ncbi:peptidyl-prolyl cis-trans isomerase ssp-1 [Rhizophagus clarus]|uniref:Peptidyl-prolyl cis-trans isomerase n=1 Tax=Rhizophagus clarus TaxID=94130 RepID=A0A8H3KW63_9GLOM|nr:peptidyl-prolyl cis-trans isomerase ssp-1 [Rhizophagus clarus]
MASPNESDNTNTGEETATTTVTTNNGPVPSNNGDAATSNDTADELTTGSVDASEWESRISRSRRMVYYYNRRTKESTWDLPPGIDPKDIKGYANNQDPQNIDPLEGGDGRIRASHLLVKHDKSRRPSSWKEPNITRTKDEALALIKSYHSRIISGEITLGQMQPSFEEAAFKLKVGELSEPVWSDTDEQTKIFEVQENYIKESE